jgi:hypothetical protein
MKNDINELKKLRKILKAEWIKINQLAQDRPCNYYSMNKDSNGTIIHTDEGYAYTGVYMYNGILHMFTNRNGHQKVQNQDAIKEILLGYGITTIKFTPPND